MLSSRWGVCCEPQLRFVAICEQQQQHTTNSFGYHKTSGVSGVWQAWLVPWAPLLYGGCKIAWEKLKCVSYSFFNLCFSPHSTIRLQICIDTAPLSNVLSRAYCAGTTKHYDKTRYCVTSRQSDIVTETRTLACHVNNTSCFARYKKGWVSRATQFQAKRYCTSQNLVEMCLSLWLWESDC